MGVYTFAVLCLFSPTAGQGVLWSLCEIFYHVLSTNSTGLWFGNGESGEQTLETVGWYGQPPWAWAIAMRPVILILVNTEAQQLPTLAFGFKKILHKINFKYYFSTLNPGCSSLLLLLSCSVLSDSFVTPWTVAHQAPLSMGFSRQDY